MRVLLDTHILLWAAAGSRRLPDGARALIENPANTLVFSAASLWEVAIKARLGRPDFRCDPRLLRRGLIDNGYEELPVTSLHAAATADLPDLHRDPFDRLLIAQSRTEGILLVTADVRLGEYGSVVRVV
ncbi:MAG: type II toxin-antitoxin system VapC family toxin [Casimicrobiaceae bacterium]|nr:type II toxin-antitoxin system VapC family toxin [Casimicrobiaceae bacterium]MDW8311688.1 type II toxin-antitoxin system VapC family toxin [Burkholderiales bacterium]